MTLLGLLALPRPTVLNGISQRPLKAALRLEIRWYTQFDRVSRQLSSTKQKLVPNVNFEVNDERARRILTIPNVLTMGRLAATPLIGYCILRGYPVTAFSLFAVSGFSDLVDGIIARKLNQQSALGSILDPLADKLLMTVLTVCLTVVGQIPAPLFALIVSRDVGLVATFCYYRWNSLPKDKRTLWWMFNPTFMSVQVSPALVSKWNTALQLSLVGLTLSVPIVNPASANALLPIPEPMYIFLDAFLIPGLWYSVALTTVWSGITYAFLRYKVIKRI